MLIDDGSAINILTWEAFRAMGGSSVELKPITNPITSFCGGTVKLMGTVKLEMKSQEHLMIKSMFNIVDMRLAYNGVVGRAIL